MTVPLLHTHLYSLCMLTYTNLCIVCISESEFQNKTAIDRIECIESEVSGQVSSVNNKNISENIAVVKQRLTTVEL